MKINLDEQDGIVTNFLQGKNKKLRGYVWGHEGFGGAFALQWVGPDENQTAIITGTTNNEERSYSDLVMGVVDALNRSAATRAGA